MERFCSAAKEGEGKKSPDNDGGGGSASLSGGFSGTICVREVSCAVCVEQPQHSFFSLRPSRVIQSPKSQSQQREKSKRSEYDDDERERRGKKFCSPTQNEQFCCCKKSHSRPQKSRNWSMGLRSVLTRCRMVFTTSLFDTDSTLIKPMRTPNLSETFSLPSTMFCIFSLA